jgi:hypothetical protein
VWARIILISVGLFVGLPWATVWVWYKLKSAEGSHFAEIIKLTMGWLLSIFVFRQLVDIARQVIFHGARLIWIDNGKVVYRYLSQNIEVQSTDIERVTTWTDGFLNRFDTITLHLRNGSESVIRSDQFSEDADVIAQRLRDVLGLRAAGLMAS